MVRLYQPMRELFPSPYAEDGCLIHTGRTPDQAVNRHPRQLENQQRRAHEPVQKARRTFALLPLLQTSNLGKRVLLYFQDRLII